MNVTKLKGKVNDLARIESQVAPQVYAFFKDTTPIRTGNARSHTHLINNTEILADYPYAQRLDEGYSPQAPSGMTAPTEEYAKKLILDAIKKTGNK
jgi:hypothetical protein